MPRKELEALTSPAGRRRADDEDPRARRFARRFGDALRVADGQLAERIVDEALAAGMAASAVHARVMAPAMYRIGELWEQAVITPADEHLATAMCHRVLASLYPHLQTSPGHPGARVLLAGIEGQHHVLGLRMVADVLEGAGHEVLFLGSDVPISSLVQAARDREPDLVGLTLTMPLGADRLDHALYRLQQDVRPDLPILLGGQGIPRRLRDLGWPYASGSEEVLACAQKLIAGDAQMPRVREPLEAQGLSHPVGTAEQQGLGTAEAHLSRMVGEAADVAREQARRALDFEQAALHDPLTGLANRRALEARMGAHGDLLTDEQALVLVDVDRFKQVNDTRGHRAGDETLTQVAEMLRSALRFGDFAARQGGDEFAALLVTGDITAARGVCVRIRSVIEQRLAGDEVTVSVGVAMGGRPDAEARADVALYEAKAAGGNAVRVDQGSAK